MRLAHDAGSEQPTCVCVCVCVCVSELIIKLQQQRYTLKQHESFHANCLEWGRGLLYIATSLY